MSKPALFLETTIQIERVVGNRTRKIYLRHELANYRLVTSTYVFGEYLRTVVKDAIQLHSLITEQTYFDDLITTIGQHPNKREASRMMLVLGELLRIGRISEQEHDQSMLLRLRERLSRYVERSLPNLFVAGIDELTDLTCCGLAQERPTVTQLSFSEESSYHLRSQCIRKVRECDLAERMLMWQPELKALLQGLAHETDPALVRMGQLIAQIIVDPVIARGRNCTWYLGDLVIALELPSDVPLYTTNLRHFGPLLAILGKKLHLAEPTQSI